MADRFRAWLSRMWSWPRRERLDRDFAEELETHAALLADDHARQGLPPAEAQRRARLVLGSVTQLREAHRDQRGLPLFDRLAQDMRFAVRMFAKSPGFTLFAGAALALGIGATTAVFSVADRVLIRPLPYRDPSRLVMVWQDDTAFGFPRNNPTPWTFTEWRARNHVFEDMAAISHTSLNLLGHGEPENLRATTVSPRFFQVLGVQAAAGRTFVDDDGRPGAPRTAVLSYSLWTRRFGADPAVVGQVINLSGTPYSVVGIMPRGFQYVDPQCCGPASDSAQQIDLWIPTQWTREFVQANQTSHFLKIVGRLRTGITSAQANAEMAGLGRQIASTGYGDGAAVVVPLHEQMIGASGGPLLALLGAVAFLLLISCANIANLLLARSSSRTREMAVRLALGASRRRVVEQLLVESVMLSVTAGVVGLVLAGTMSAVLLHLVPPGFSGPSVEGFDGIVLAFCAGISIATGIVFGLLPALRSSHIRLAPALREGSAQAGGGGQRLRGALVIIEVATAVILLSGAALMIRSFEKLVHQDPGFTADRVLTLETPLPQPRYAEPGRRRAFYRDVLQRLQNLPGVTAAGYSTFLPLASAAGGALVTVENRPIDPHHVPIINVRVVTPGYFPAVGMRLTRGRLVSPDDTPESLKILVINETMARMYWPAAEPIGRRLRVGATAQAPWVTVVGVVADMRQGGLDVPIRPEGYFPVTQFDSFAPDALAIRTSGDSLSIADAVRQQIWMVDKEQPVVGMATLGQLVDGSVLPARMQAALFGGFGGIALVLAALGIYAVLSFTVTQRIREIGVRVALGAQPRNVLAMIISQGLKLFGAGLVIGIVAAVGLSHLIAHLLFGVTATDPVSFAAVIGTLLAVTLVACYVPARRAVAIDPLRALRWE